MMSVYLVDIGPHRTGRRWMYIVADGKQTTDLYATAKQALAAWASGKRHGIWRHMRAVSITARDEQQVMT